MYRYLALIKVAASVETRTQVMQLVDVFRARVVDVAPDSLIIEITGTDEKIDGLLEILRPFGVMEVARTGQLAMTRGNAGRGRPRRRAAATDEPVDAAVSRFLCKIACSERRSSAGHHPGQRAGAVPLRRDRPADRLPY